MENRVGYLWEEGIELPRFPSLKGNKQTDVLVIGGGSHRTGKRGGGWSELADFVSKSFRGAEIRAMWAARDCITLDGIPYIGRYSKSTPDLYVASGFNKWGLTSSMVAADILSD